MHIILSRCCYLGVPLSYKLGVFVDLVRLDLVEDDRVYVFAARQDLREAPLNILVELPSLGRTIDEC